MNTKKQPATENGIEAEQQPIDPEAESVGPEALDGEVEATAEVVSPEDFGRLLEEKGNEANQHRDALLRAQAELENFRKRAARELENAHKYGLERFISELLPVKDSMELGISAAENSDAELSHVHEGMELTLKMLQGAIAKFGVEELNPAGEPFNPDFHQAMTLQESEEAGSGTVLTVVQRGYLLNGRLVRPAMVIVAK